MATKHKSKGTVKKERTNYNIAKLNGNREVQGLLGLYNLSLVGDEVVGDEAKPKFGVGHLMPLSIYQDGCAKKLEVLPTIDRLSQHLGFASDEVDEVRSLPIPDKYLDRLIKSYFREGKDELSKYLTKLRPLLYGKGIYFYTLPLGSLKTIVELGDFEESGAVRVLCALPLSRQVAELRGCSQEEILALAPQVAWLIPRLVDYGKVKDADKLIAALDGWKDLLTHQQKEQVFTSVETHDRPVINRKVKQLLLF